MIQYVQNLKLKKRGILIIKKWDDVKLTHTLTFFFKWKMYTDVF